MLGCPLEQSRAGGRVCTALLHLRACSHASDSRDTSELQRRRRSTHRQAHLQAREDRLCPATHTVRVARPRCGAWQVLWTFSIYLEAVAIIPQLVLLQRTQNIDNLTGNYVFLLGRAGPAAAASR